MSLELTTQARGYLTSKLKEKKVSELKQRWGLLEVEKKSYPIWANQRIHADVWSGDITISTHQPILIKSIISAKLIVSVKAELAPSNGTIWLNNKEIATHDFRFGGIWEETFDVTSLILSGDNIFTYRVGKIAMIGFGDTYVTVNLLVEAEKGGVVVGPTMPEWLQIALAIGGGLLVLGLGIVLIRRRK